jgi:hypothetical protein
VRIIASLRTDWDDAAPLLNEAIDALRELNRAADPSDTYAIVTLAEGHISVILRFFGVALASNKLASSKGCLLLHDETFAEPRRKFSFEPNAVVPAIKNQGFHSSAFISQKRIKSFCGAKPTQKLRWSERGGGWLRRPGLWNFQAGIGAKDALGGAIGRRVAAVG